MSFNLIKVKLIHKMSKTDWKLKMIIQKLLSNEHLFSPIKI
jgi:hypothetical protein